MELLAYFNTGCAKNNWTPILIDCNFKNKHRNTILMKKKKENRKKKKKKKKSKSKCFICGASSRYLYKIGDHKSPKSKKNTWKAELGHTAFF